jgi:hypothetical protein
VGGGEAGEAGEAARKKTPCCDWGAGGGVRSGHGVALKQAWRRRRRDAALLLRPGSTPGLRSAVSEAAERRPRPRMPPHLWRQGTVRLQRVLSSVFSAVRLQRVIRTPLA